ncbi:hypothetical protein NUH87_00965 [Pseudomonas batumici]|uniref:hypothetical protein n=1 Tax=Pseudomonas batumici TaxID=226910 RepID=UPI0030D43B23
MITITYDNGWDSKEFLLPNLESKVPQSEHDRLITNALQIVRNTAYPPEKLTGNASKIRLGEFKKACDDQVPNVLRVQKGIHQRYTAHITAQLDSNGITYHLNVMGRKKGGDDKNARFIWEIVSISSDVDAVEELQVVDSAGLFHPRMRRNSISLADYNDAQVAWAIELERRNQQTTNEQLVNKVMSAIESKLQCKPKRMLNFKEKLLNGEAVPFLTKKNLTMMCTLVAEEKAVEYVIAGGIKKKFYL